MAKVTAYRDESTESLIKRFKQKVNKEGLISDIRKHEFYQKPSEIERNRKNEVRRKAAKKKALLRGKYGTN